MLGAIAAGIGALISGGAGAVVSLGSSILGGVGSLAAGGVSAVGSTLLGGGGSSGVTVGQQMAAIAEPAYYETADGGGISGIAGMLADILPTVGGVMSLIRKPEEQVIVPASAGTMPTPGITIPTLPAIISKQAQPGQQIFTTPAATAAKPDYLPYLAIGGLALLLFMRKK